MTDPCEVLAWDSSFFGFPIARATGDRLTAERMRAIDSWCTANRVRCLYLLSRADDPLTTRLAEDHGFHLADVRLTLRRSGPCSPTGPVRPARPEDIPILESISGECYQDSRFYYDLNFPRSLCASLYATWIRLSCEGFADAVLVAEFEGTAVGYVSCHLREAKIGLVGVSSRARGAGVGATLVERAVEWFQARGVGEVFVVTQGRNGAAQRLYQRCGFLTHAVQLWYHKWYPSGE